MRNEITERVFQENERETGLSFGTLARRDGRTPGGSRGTSPHAGTGRSLRLRECAFRAYGTAPGLYCRRSSFCSSLSTAPGISFLTRLIASRKLLPRAMNKPGNDGSGSPDTRPTVHQNTLSPGDVLKSCHECLKRSRCRNTAIFDGEVDDLESVISVCVEQGPIIIIIQFLPGQQDNDGGHRSLMELGAERFEAVHETGSRFRFEAVRARGTGRIHETIVHLDFDYAHLTSIPYRYPHGVHHAILLEVLKHTLPVLALY